MFRFGACTFLFRFLQKINAKIKNRQIVQNLFFHSFCLLSIFKLLYLAHILTSLRLTGKESLCQEKIEYF